MNCSEKYTAESDLTLGQFSKSTFTIDINFDAKTEEGKDRTVKFGERGFATMWHEYSHFIQATSTFSGIAEIYLLFDQIVDFSKDRQQILGMKHRSLEEMTKLPNLGETFRQLHGMSSCWYHFIDRDIMFNPPIGVEDFQLFKGKEIGGFPTLWLKIPVDEGSACGIRMTRTIFTEGMARAIGEQISGHENRDEIRKHPEQLHYYALRLFIERWLPDVDPSLATIVVGDACLFDTSPATTFLNFVAGVSRNENERKDIGIAVKNVDSIWIAKKYNRYFEEEQKEVLDHADIKIAEMARSSSKDANHYVGLLFDFVRTRLKRRLNANSDLITLAGAKTKTEFELITTDYGCPMVRVGKGMSSFSFDKEQQIAWQVFCLGNSFVRKELSQSANACPFVEDEVCLHAGKDDTCKSDFSRKRIDSKGNECMASHVADLMGIGVAS